ncbi:hypothetical protein [Candidatus Mycobacterium methanotrophicum]|nr:hypothetical protein [Candidatus Mycobacterium methanotrophicum]
MFDAAEYGPWALIADTSESVGDEHPEGLHLLGICPTATSGKSG